MEDRLNKDNSNLKFKCGYCFFASASRNETVRHVRAEHDGKILRIQVSYLHIAADRISVVSLDSLAICDCLYKIRRVLIFIMIYSVLYLDTE